MNSGDRQKAILAFSRRLNDALDEIDDCPKTRGRTRWLHEKMRREMGYEGVRKWIAGEAMPSAAHMGKLATIAKVQSMWLHSGMEPRRISGTDATTAQLRNVWAKLDETARAEVVRFAEFQLMTMQAAGRTDLAAPVEAPHSKN